VCEFVRTKSSQAFASARSCPTSVRHVRVSSHQSMISTSLRGWRSQERGGSNPPFRTTPPRCFGVVPQGGVRHSAIALRARLSSTNPRFRTSFYFNDLRRFPWWSLRVLKGPRTSSCANPVRIQRPPGTRSPVRAGVGVLLQVGARLTHVGVSEEHLHVVQIRRRFEESARELASQIVEVKIDRPSRAPR
jgi:hypothetical protein